MQLNMGFPGSLDGKESTCIGGDLGSIPGLGRSPRGGRAWSIPWTKEPAGLQSMGVADLDTTEPLRAQTQETAFSKESSSVCSRLSVLVS